jgi:hypothetical protein
LVEDDHLVAAAVGTKMGRNFGIGLHHFSVLLSAA